MIDKVEKVPGALSRRGVLELAGAAGLVTVLPGRPVFANVDQDRELVVEATRLTIDGRESGAIAIGGSVPGPVLRWQEGEDVVIRVTNRLPEPTSIHWHGILLPGAMDGAPGFNGYIAIPSGETWTYRFQLRQAGTYWYHSHSAMQEQAGMYGAIIIEPKQREPVRADRDYVVLLSDHTADAPVSVLRNLKASSEYYNKGRRTLVDFFRDVGRNGWSATVDDRLDWGEMRMDPTDLADVTGYDFLVNGKGPSDNWTGLFEPGERVRLRIINGSAMSFFDVAIPGLPMTVVAADGQHVIPVKVDEFRFGVGETYDVIVRPTEAKAYTLMAEPLDRSGYARATLAPKAGMEAPIPPLRPRATLAMSDMPASHGGHAGHDMAAMDGGGMDHAAMGHDMAGMDHAAMGHGAAEATPSSPDAQPVGWDKAGTPAGAKALAYADLKALKPNADLRAPSQEIEVNLTGIMERYIWTMNGRKFGDEDVIRVKEGERVRLRFVNDTMMAHPMHLHGMFMELENGQSERMPKKHVIIVPPGKTVTAVLTADEVGEWPFHCHLLYHMASGMMTRFIVEPKGTELSSVAE
ncbi:MAG: copper resistance system multicopper oxidase [Alphaproteobacteria bacterium]